MGKVLITEKVHPIGPQLLRAAGHQVVQVENRDMAQIAREIVDADAVIVRIIDLPGLAAEDSGASAYCQQAWSRD